MMLSERSAHWPQDPEGDAVWYCVTASPDGHPAFMGSKSLRGWHDGQAAARQYVRSAA